MRGCDCHSDDYPFHSCWRFDWRKEMKLVLKVGETSIFRAVLGFALIVLLVDLLGFAGWQSQIVAIPVMFTLNYVYGRLRGVYKYEGGGEE